MTPFGRVMAGLIGLVVIVALAGLAWFGFRFVRDEVLTGNGEVDEEDIAFFERQLAECTEIARRAKGTGQFTYQSWKRAFPACARFVTLRVWQAI